MSDPIPAPRAGPGRSVLAEALEPGDYVPRINLPDPDGRVVSLMHQTIAGGLVVLVCPARGADLRPWAKAVEPLRGLGGRLFVVTEAAVPLPAPLEGLIDAQDVLRPTLGLAGDGVIVLDPAGRLAGRLEGGSAKPAAVLAECRRLHAATEPQVIAAQAPVIVLPELISPALCERLLRYWRDGEKRQGTVARDGDRFAYDASLKQREDVLLTDDALMGELMHAVRWRVAPAIGRAFNWELAQAEAFRIGCYPAGKGYFRRHRDNSNANTSHRLFAISINLNEAYVGGELVFPEYGRMRYRPPAGGAVVFSSSLLHEALDVTEGQRFAVFSFFSDKAGAARVAERLARKRSPHDSV